MMSDAELSHQIAQQAGALLLSLRTSFGAIDPADKDRANALRKEGDRQSHELIAGLLAKHRPADAVLSEEGADNDLRLSAERVWIVDPLDGTWEFGQNRSDFAVHVALWEPARSWLSACTVDLPAQGLTRSMLDDASGSAASFPLPTDRPIRIVASRSRPPAALAQACDLLGARLAASGASSHGVEIVDVGSVGAKVNELLAGRAEAYVHDTGFYEWDVAAPYGVAWHYGFPAMHVDGSQVTFNHMPPYVTDLIVSHPALIEDLRAAFAEASSR